jgi:hypothetical protein
MILPSQPNWHEFDLHRLIHDILKQKLLLPDGVLEVPIVSIERRTEVLLLPLF